MCHFIKCHVVVPVWYYHHSVGRKLRPKETKYPAPDYLLVLVSCEMGCGVQSCLSHQTISWSVWLLKKSLFFCFRRSRDSAKWFRGNDSLASESQMARLRGQLSNNVHPPFLFQVTFKKWSQLAIPSFESFYVHCLYEVGLICFFLSKWFLLCRICAI